MMASTFLPFDCVLVTGSAGFIGTNFVLDWMAARREPILSLDKLTYAGNRANLAALDSNPRHVFVQGDIADAALVAELLQHYKPKAIVNFAAESHVDRSIHNPETFIETNVVGTARLLDATRGYLQSLTGAQRDDFRFLHVSTDEVYGSLSPQDPPFTESSRYCPNSPYAASKASSDHMVHAYYHTYDMPTLTTNCSNNYGPYQFPEKLIPLIIHHALTGKPLPIYGDGKNVRDWLYVGDHCAAVRCVLDGGRPGEVYNIGGENEAENITVVHRICDMLDRLRPLPNSASYRNQITYVTDRPGHDRRYAIDARKIRSELGWAPQETFATGIEKTVRWYLENSDWVESVTNGTYRTWIKTNYETGLRGSR
jgi:dTDP-glucose 4,6-dehydratase